jgi:hypothetical protein
MPENDFQHEPQPHLRTTHAEQSASLHFAFKVPRSRLRRIVKQPPNSMAVRMSRAV